MGICDYHRDEWLNTQRVRALFKQYFVEEQTPNAIQSSLQRYHVYGLLKRKKIKGSVFYKISQRGHERLIWLSKTLLPVMTKFAQNAESNPFSVKLIRDYEKLFALATELIDPTNWDDTLICLRADGRDCAETKAKIKNLSIAIKLNQNKQYHGDQYTEARDHLKAVQKVKDIQALIKETQPEPPPMQEPAPETLIEKLDRHRAEARAVTEKEVMEFGVKQ